MTVFDKIKSLTPIELAKQDWIDCPFYECDKDLLNMSNDEADATCVKCIHEWLVSEYKEVTTMVDLSKPQHFTKEQSEWIKAYVSQKNKEFYSKAIDDFVANVKDTLITDYSVFNTDDIRIFIDIIEELAKQLKAGEKNEN